MELERQRRGPGSAEKGGRGQRVLAVSISAVKDNGATATFIAPNGVLLSEGTQLTLIEKLLEYAGFRTCLVAAYISVAELDTQSIAQLSGGKKAMVSMTDTNGRKIQLAVSLSGFTAAWKHVKDLST